MMQRSVIRSGLAFVLACSAATSAFGQHASSGPTAAPVTAGNARSGATLPPGYVIGPADVLSITFWKDKDMTADVIVRPDGKISLPLLNDVQAAGYTPEELRVHVVEAAAKYLEEPNPTVVVREVHSRNVYITGSVMKPGPYALTSGMNVLQLIASASGLLEYADAKNIVIIRTEQGRQAYLPFNYRDVVKQKNTQQNIPLKPGDTVVVP